VVFESLQRHRALRLLPLLCLIALLATIGAVTRRDTVPRKDASDNLLTGFHVWTTGNFSRDGQTLTYRREPLPIALTGVHMALFTGIPSTAAASELLTTRAYFAAADRVNLYYGIALSLALWLLAWQLTGSQVVAALAIVGSWIYFVYGELGWQHTELPAALFMALAAACCIWLQRSLRISAALLAGVMLGALALTKASALYVAVVAIPMLALAQIALNGTAVWRAAALYGLMGLAFAATITPWMLRNYVQFGDFAISQRGGEVLLIRAVKNQMTPDEYAGAFYVYAPPGLQKAVFERLLGFDASDIEEGGRYSRLNRNLPSDKAALHAHDYEHLVSYYQRAKWTIPQAIRKDLAAQGLPLTAYGAAAHAYAMHMIEEAPLKHLTMTLPFAWRGLWGMGDAWKLNLAVYLALLALPLAAIFTRRMDWFALSIVANGFFWFHALLTHFIPRYSEPLVPLAILSLLVLVHALYLRAAARLGGRYDFHAFLQQRGTV